jgi:hypothetical protein
VNAVMNLPVISNAGKLSHDYTTSGSLHSYLIPHILGYMTCLVSSSFGITSLHVD